MSESREQLAEHGGLELLAIARALVALLEDPHPGLLTWRKFLAEKLEAIRPWVEAIEPQKEKK
jgi:hypothetical protein